MNNRSFMQLLAESEKYELFEVMKRNYFGNK